MAEKSFPLRDFRTLRTDRWELAPLATGGALVAIAAYMAWAVLQGGGYSAGPYLSPLYSPFLAAMVVPLGLRATCYYYRKVYYRAFFLLPPACGVQDAWSGYGGEARFPLVLQNAHRYFLYLSLGLLVFVWIDALRALRFPEGPGLGLGSVVLLANASLLTLFALSCNSCRHACGGHVKSLHGAPLRARAWTVVSALNRHHALFGWASFASVIAADGYVRLLAAGVLRDPRFL